MVKQATKKFGAGEGGTPLAPFLMNGPMSGVISRAGEAWTKACIEWQQELARFASSRIEGDIALVKSMAQCQNLLDVAKVQREWATATLNDYASETEQLMQIASRAAQEGIAVGEAATGRRAEA